LQKPKRRSSVLSEIVHFYHLGFSIIPLSFHSVSIVAQNILNQALELNLEDTLKLSMSLM
jgi:hypothetical protein